MNDANNERKIFKDRLSKFGLDIFDPKKAEQAWSETFETVTLNTIEAFNKRCEICDSVLWFVPAENNKPYVYFYKVYCCGQRYSVSKFESGGYKKIFEKTCSYSIMRNANETNYDRSYYYSFGKSRTCKKCNSGVMEFSSKYSGGHFCLNDDCDESIFIFGG